MKRFFDSNLFYGILSVVMAVFLMLYVSSVEDPVVERNFTDISVTATDLPVHLFLNQEPGSVEIRASGYRSAVNTSLARDIRAYIDLRNATTGTTLYPVQYSLPNGLSLVYIRPEYLSLTLDELDVLELPVRYYTTNALPEGYRYEDPVISPSTILVSGPRQWLDQIGEAKVSLDLDGRLVSFDGSLPVVLLDHQDEPFLNGSVSLSAEEVRVFVEISENLSSKNVSVRVALSGNVNERYSMAGIEIQPLTVKITGTYSTVSTIEYLMTETVDLSLLSDTFTGPIRIVVPPGVSVLDGETVELTIRLEKNLIQTALVNVPIEMRNVPEGSLYYTEPDMVNLILRAFPDLIEAATIDGELDLPISVYVDLDSEESSEGESPLPQYPLTMELKVELPEDFDLVMISEEQVTVYETGEQENQ